MANEAANGGTTGTGSAASNNVAKGQSINVNGQNKNKSGVGSKGNETKSAGCC